MAGVTTAAPGAAHPADHSRAEALAAWPWQCAPSGRTWPMGGPVPAGWLAGRRRYAVWVIELAPGVAEAPGLAHRLARLRRCLSPWLLVGPRQAHITLQVCGFTPEGRPPGAAPRPDDYTDAMRHAQCQALRAWAPQPFELEIGGPDSFDSAAFLRVADPQGVLPGLRQALALGHDEFRSSAWVPHITLGLYRRALHKASLGRLLAQIAPGNSHPLRLRVQALSLMDYQADTWQGSLRPLWRHRLGPGVA